MTYADHVGLHIPDPLPPPDLAYHHAVATALVDHGAALVAAVDHLRARTGILAEVAARLVTTLRAGNKVLVAGNGGSAAEAQHFATELVGRFRREREPYPVLALTCDGAVLTALANDYGYREVFARQVRAFGRPGDLLLAFSTSGESENLLQAARVARERALTVVAVTGSRPSRLDDLADLTVRVPTADTPLAQELHMLITHLLCDIAETELAAQGPAR